MRERKRKRRGIHKSCSVALSLCHRRWTECLSTTADIWTLIYGVFLNLPIHFNPVWKDHWSPPAHVIRPANAERHTNAQVSLNLCMCAPRICTSLASHWCTHANWTHARLQPGSVWVLLQTETPFFTMFAFCNPNLFSRSPVEL